MESALPWKAPSIRMLLVVLTDLTIKAKEKVPGRLEMSPRTTQITKMILNSWERAGLSVKRLSTHKHLSLTMLVIKQLGSHQYRSHRMTDVKQHNVNFEVRWLRGKNITDDALL